MNKGTLHKYIIYKIFTSKYKDLFVLDGSYGLYINSTSDLKRVVHDLDLDKITLGKLNSDKEINWGEFIAILSNIFKDNKDVKIKIIDSSDKVRKYNKNSAGASIEFNIEGEVLKLDVSIIFNSIGIIEVNWFVNDNEIFDKWNLVKNQNITIKTFEDERYFVNKLLTSMKITREYKNQNVDISKTIYDMWYISQIKNNLNVLNIVNHYELMYEGEFNIADTMNKLLFYIKTNEIKIINKLNSFVGTNLVNNYLDGFKIVNDIVDYIKIKIEEIKEVQGDRNI